MKHASGGKCVIALGLRRHVFVCMCLCKENEFVCVCTHICVYACIITLLGVFFGHLAYILRASAESNQMISNHNGQITFPYVTIIMNVFVMFG